MQMRFMQEAFIGILLLAPLTAAAGIQVVNFRMAFFSDAIGHSVFAGVAIGLLLSVSPAVSMPVTALIVGGGIMLMKRCSRLSSDTVIGVFYSAVAAAGLALISRNPNVARDMQTFLYGDILTISGGEIAYLFILSVAFYIFQIFAFNKLMIIGLDEKLAKAHRIKTALYEFIYVALLALTVIVAVRAAGVLLVTALLIVPSAAARNLASSAGKMFFLALATGLFSGITGLLLSAQESINASSGAMIVLVASAIFLVTLFLQKKG
ncbi:MAG: metal ABC transporter permease [Lentisphaeria bacterium]|nr:metal ABC transporter permease [Lentisphaeria bacterium]